MDSLYINSKTIQKYFITIVKFRIFIQDNLKEKC